MFFTASYGSERRLSTNMHSSHSRALTLSPYRPTGYLSQLTVAPHVGGWRPSSAVCYAPYSTIGRVVRVLYNYYIGSLITRTETGYACVRSADPFPMLRPLYVGVYLHSRRLWLVPRLVPVGRRPGGGGRQVQFLFSSHIFVRVGIH
jgi:hypothetical protein